MCVVILRVALLLFEVHSFSLFFFLILLEGYLDSLTAWFILNRGKTRLYRVLFFLFFFPCCPSSSFFIFVCRCARGGGPFSSKKFFSVLY